MAVDPLTERLKDQVSASIQDSLIKATSVLSNLHRVQSYLDVLANLPVARAGDIIKSAVEQVRGMKDDTTSLLQTVYLTEIGLGSLQELDRGGGVGLSDVLTTDVGPPLDHVSTLLDSVTDNSEDPLPPAKKLKLGVSIHSCVSCSRKFAHQSSSDTSSLCRVCRGEESPTQHSPSVQQEGTPLSKSTPRGKKRKSVPQKCSLCGAGFVYRRCLLRHIKENHPNVDTSNLEQYIQQPSVEQGAPLSAGGGTEVHLMTSHDSIVEHVLGEFTPSSLHVTIESEGSLSHDLTAGSHDTSNGATEEETQEALDGKCTVLTVNGEKVYKCRQCSKTFSRPYRIQRHLQVHNPSRHKVQCHICGKYFTRVDTLQTHIRCVHTDERPFACTFEGCDKSFPVQSGLVHHLKSHMDGKPYKCPECSEAFALMTEFKGHMTSQHADTKDLRCSDCYKLFSTPFELEQHRSLEHRLECEICNKTFARLGFLQAHVEIHSGPSLYNCRFCNSGFDNEYSYKQHVKTHPKYNRVRKVHPCPVCGDSFMDANDLMEHYQSEDHRDKVKSLGVSGNMLAAMGTFGGTGDEVVSSGETSFGGGDVASSGDAAFGGRDVASSGETAFGGEDVVSSAETATGLSDEALIRSISESDAFQVALAGGGVN